MFRSARQIEAEAAEKRLDAYRDHWKRTADQWFDGSVESVDKRLANLDQVIAFAGHTAQLQGSRVGSFCLAALPNLKASREELVDLRQHLAGGSWEAEHGPGLAGGMWAPWQEKGLIDQNPMADAAHWGGPEGHGRGFIAPGGNNGFQDLPPEGMAVHRDTSGRERILDRGGEERFSSKLAHAATDFIESQNTSDRQELLTRAARLVEARTSSWSVDASTKAVRAFVGAVEDQIPRTRTAAVQTLAAVDDFEDHLMFS